MLPGAVELVVRDSTRGVRRDTRENLPPPLFLRSALESRAVLSRGRGEIHQHERMLIDERLDERLAERIHEVRSPRSPIVEEEL